MKRLGRYLAIVLAASALPLAEAAVLCTVASVPTPVRSEGLTELTGDIQLGCSAAPGERINSNLTIFYSVNVTNRATDGSLDAKLLLDGVPLGVPAVAMGANSVAFNGVSLDVPAGGAFSLRVTGVRVAVAQQGVDNSAPIQAFLSMSGPTSAGLTQSNVIVGYPRRGLLSSGNNGSVNCYGSSVPGTISVSGLFAAGTRRYSTRVSEGFPNAFEKASANATGTRILIRWSDLPSGTHLFVPDVIAGTDALQPTSGGDLNLTASGGAYRPSGAGSLVLSRVLDADVNGAGGTPVYVPDPAAGDVTFNGAHEVTLSDGAGSAAFEVVESNPSLEESAHIPVFFGLPGSTPVATSAGKQSVSFGPLSTVANVSPTAPVPRFTDALPPLDCTARGDCDTFPKLEVEPWGSFDFTALAGGKKQSQYAYVKNTGAGVLAWSLNIVYKNGADWINLYAEPNRGNIPGWFRLDVDPAHLAAGTYEASVVVDAGPTSGSQAIPVRLVVTPSTLPAAGSVVNAASFAGGALTPGSIATIFGERLGGKAVQVSLDGIAARVFYSDAGQINFLVPEELAGRPSAQLVVTADGLAGAPKTVALGTMNPAVFANGILNQDFSVNSPSKPAARESVLQIYATGLPSKANGTVLVKLGSAEITSLEYAGAAPGLAGVSQVNVRVPAGTPSGAVDLVLCGVASSSTTQACGPVVKAYIQ